MSRMPTLSLRTLPPPEGADLAREIDQIYLRSLLRRLEAAELSPQARRELLSALRKKQP